MGCTSTPSVKLRTETVTVDRPILYCPSVDVDALDRPVGLPIDAITATTSQGEVAVLYKATVRMLLDYTIRLELMLNQYNTYNKSYDELLKDLNSENVD